MPENIPLHRFWPTCRLSPASAEMKKKRHFSYTRPRVTFLRPALFAGGGSRTALRGVVEKPGPGSERVPLVLHGHRIDLTLSSRRRRRIEGRSPSTRSRCAPALPRYGARARLLRMREEFRRGSNVSDERAFADRRGRYYVQGRRMRRRHFSLGGLFQQPLRGRKTRTASPLKLSERRRLPAEKRFSGDIPDFEMGFS